MLNIPDTSEPKDRPAEEDRKKDVKNDPSAEFIQEMAESGAANDLGTINAAADAVEGKESRAVRRHLDKEADRTDDDEPHENKDDE